MIRTHNGPTNLRTLPAMALLALSLSACEDGASFLGSGDAKNPDSPNKVSATNGSGDQDVEAPDVFQVTEAALWDGRPSLGGVWVAHPDVTDPQRVLIRNTTNGKSVVGALFRRERDVPGPRLQASSDAAEALSMLAGAPVQLNVTALIREPAKQPEPDTPDADAAAAPATESAAVDEDTPDAVDPARASDTADGTAETKSDPEPKRGFRWPWSKPKNSAPAAAVAAAATAESVASPSTVSTEPLAASSTLNKPYVQIGIFSDKENAERAASRMRSSGMAPVIYEQKSAEKNLWRVLVGPSSTTSDQTALLDKVRAAGFSDAYTVAN